MKKQEKVEANGIFPRHASPAETEIIFYSAIKHSTKLSGQANLNFSEKVEFFKSASNTTRDLCFSPSFFKASP